MAVAQPQIVTRRSKPFYRVLRIQVLIGIALVIALGALSPNYAAAMKPFGAGFINLIKMMIALIIFCTDVSGMAGISDQKKGVRVGAKSLLHFEVVPTLALVIGLIVANWVKPDAGLNANPANLDAAAVMGYASKAKRESVPEFLLDIIPDTAVGAFADGNILQVLLVAVLFGVSLSALGERTRRLTELVD